MTNTLLSINNYHHVRGGSDMVYFNHSNLFAARGWSTRFFSMQHKRNLPCEDSKYFVKCLEHPDGRGQIWTPENALKVIYSLEAKKKLGLLLDGAKVNLAHAHNIYHYLSPSILSETHSRGIPTVMTAHDLKLVCPNYRMFNRRGICECCRRNKVWNVALHRCVKDEILPSLLIAVEAAVHRRFRYFERYLSYVITPSRFYRRKFIEWGYPPEKLVYIPNYVSGNSIPLSGQTGQYVLYFGRLTPEKGLVTLITAAAQAKVPLCIVGKGPQENDLRQLTERVLSPVEFLGFRSGSDLVSIIDGAKFVVLPSEWYENSPISVLEAFQRGKPLVGARIGGITEMIEEGRTGWSFRSGDVSDLTCTLAKAFSTPNDELAEMGAACQELVRECFCEERYHEAMSAIYAKLM